MRTGKLAAVAAGVALAGGLGVALGFAATGTTDQINACVSDGGWVRVITGKDTCRRDESPVSWSITGPQGSQGSKGATGAQGSQGSQGSKGTTGAQGPQGSKGATGAEGPAGQTNTVETPVIGQFSATGQEQGAIKGGDGSETMIDFTGFTEGVVSPRDPASGLPTGKRQHEPITITKEIDAASPRLYNVCVTNENLTKVVIDLDSPGGSTPTTEITLTNASCSDLEHNGQTETVSFTFQKIEWTYINGGITASDDWETPEA